MIKRADVIGKGSVISTYPHLTDSDRQTVIDVVETPKYVRITRKPHGGISQTNTYRKSTKLMVTVFVPREK